MANFISIFRVIMAFIVIGLLFFPSKESYITAFIMTILVIWFDGLDGYVARKFNESSKFGAVLDIMGDRIVENIYWVAFAVLGWVSVTIPIVVLTRGIIVDSLRSLALEKGYTAFGSSTMMKDRVRKYLVASNLSRFSYAVTKALAFTLIIAGNIPFNYPYRLEILSAGLICALIAVIFCVLRGLPVIFESERFINND